MLPNVPKLSHGGKPAHEKQNKAATAVGSSALLGHMVEIPTYQTIIKDSSGQILHKFKTGNKNHPLLATMAYAKDILETYPLNEIVYLEISRVDSPLSTSST
jgi:hypothetical protein